jgi:Glutathione S-transferase, N-terminal domain
MTARNMPAKPENLVLYGRYASPFVRRVAVTLRLYDIGYQHVPLMPFGRPGSIRSRVCPRCGSPTARY